MVVRETIFDHGDYIHHRLECDDLETQLRWERVVEILRSLDYKDAAPLPDKEPPVATR